MLSQAAFEEPSAYSVGSPGIVSPDSKHSPRLAFLDERIMAEVRLMPVPRNDFFAPRDWLIAGFVMALSMGLIPFGQDFAKVMALFGAGFSLPLSLVLGVVLTSYAAYFVATHLDEVQSFVTRRTRFR